MGGLHSGKKRNKKPLVEEADIFDVDIFLTKLGAGVDALDGRTININYGRANIMTSISFTAPFKFDPQTEAPDYDLRIKFEYGIEDKYRFHCIFIKAYHSKFGAKRHYAICGQCQKRCSVLYKPRHGKGYYCRNCHDLTYHSSRVHDDRVNKYLDGKKDPPSYIDMKYPELDESAAFSLLMTFYKLELQADNFDEKCYIQCARKKGRVISKEPKWKNI